MNSIVQGFLLHRTHIILHECLDIKADHVAWMFREQCVEIILWLRLVQDLDNIPLTGEKIQVKADIRVPHTADPEAVDIVGTALADLVGDDLGKLFVVWGVTLTTSGIYWAWQTSLNCREVTCPLVVSISPIKYP